MTANADVMEAQSLEARLNAFDGPSRREALRALADMAAGGALDLPEVTRANNMHCHSFYSYNGYGLSPSGIAWALRKEGVFAAGLVDFDGLDGVEEFLEACALLGLRAAAGLETRVYIPAFAEHVVNSPGEPGISYHMAEGFVSPGEADAAMLARLRGISDGRNQMILERVNPILAPVSLDYETEVLPLTPSGGATERHLCAAYAGKAEQLYPDAKARVAFWAERLGEPADRVAPIVDDLPKLEALIRARMMKQGGAGYVRPEPSTFPDLDAFNRFALAAEAVPMQTWLDGLSDGEQRIEQLMDLHLESGTAALNIIPDRNWNVADKELAKRKIAELHRVVELAGERGMPVIAGTELNAPGLRLVDDFDAEPMKPVAAAFETGALIMYAHTRLKAAGMGYCSAWSREHFDSVHDKNSFFRRAGAALEPGARLPDAAAGAPEAVLAALGAGGRSS